MSIQLDILSPIYYITLGYYEELINYLFFIDDSSIYDLFLEYNVKCNGRHQNDPVVLFRMHFLYFTRPDLYHLGNRESSSRIKNYFEILNGMISAIRESVMSHKYFCKKAEILGHNPYAYHSSNLFNEKMLNKQNED